MGFVLELDKSGTDGAKCFWVSGKGGKDEDSITSLGNDRNLRFECASVLDDYIFVLF